VFFHGGGFVICDLETHDSLCRWLADSSGMPLLSVDYRLAPEAPFPAQLDDGEAAVRWAIANADALGLDPRRLLLAGDSAGGYIAVALAARLNAERPGAVAGQALLYPLLELDDDAWASSIFAHARIVGRVAVGYIRSQLGPESAAATSLVGIDPALMPPTLIAAGGHLDPCRPDARRLAERLRAAGRPVTLLEYPRLPHGFGSITHLSVAARRAMAEIGVAARALADREPVEEALRSAGGGRPRGRRAPTGRRG
jgi:acetyl esterase